MRSEEQSYTLTKKSIITQLARALTLNSEECWVYNLILPSRVDSACTSFIGRACSVGPQQFNGLHPQPMSEPKVEDTVDPRIDLRAGSETEQ